VEHVTRTWEMRNALKVLSENNEWRVTRRKEYVTRQTMYV